MSIQRTRPARTKGYDPEPIDVPPLFRTPPRPAEMLRWLVTKFMWPQSALWIAIAALVYHVFTPALTRFSTLSIDDVALLWLRNVVLMVVVIGGQHWWLHIRRAQGTEFKYELRWLAKNRKSFLFDDQIEPQSLSPAPSSQCPLAAVTKHLRVDLKPKAPSALRRTTSRRSTKGF